jgi:hypothetical protein
MTAYKHPSALVRNEAKLVVVTKFCPETLAAA